MFSFTMTNYCCMVVVALTCLVAMIVIGLSIKSSEAILKTIPPNKRAEVEEKQVSARFYLLLPFFGLIYVIFFGRPDPIPTLIAVVAIIGGITLYRINYFEYARKVSVQNLQGNRPAETTPEATGSATTETSAPGEEKSGS